MKREDLEAIGMTKEQIDKVLDMHHEEYDPVKKDLDTANADLAAEKEKTSTQETTIAGLKKDLGEFKDADVSGMKQKIEDLEKDIQTKDAAHKQEIADRDFNDLLKECITAAKGVNAKAITALLDVDTLKESKNQKEDIATAIDEEVKSIIDDCYAQAKKIISDHMDVLEKSSQLLLEKEKVTREEFEALFNDNNTDDAVYSVTETID